MDIGISPQNEDFLRSQIASGIYPDRQHALDAAIDLLRERTSILESIDRAREQLDSGDSTEYDQAGLAARFGNLKSRFGGSIDSSRDSA